MEIKNMIDEYDIYTNCIMYDICRHNGEKYVIFRAQIEPYDEQKLLYTVSLWNILPFNECIKLSEFNKYNTRDIITNHIIHNIRNGRVPIFFHIYNFKNAIELAFDRIYDKRELKKLYDINDKTEEGNYWCDYSITNIQKIYNCNISGGV